MIHTIYSNSYEVLRAVLLSNIERLGFASDEADAFEASGDPSFAELCSKVFERVPVIIPSRAIEVDLQRAIAEKSQVCAAMDFMYLSAWMGFFSKEPLANVVGNEADWMIWRILSETGPGSFREAVRKASPASRLERYLEGRSSEEIFSLARHISRVFVAYATYRVDWLFDWLDIHRELVPNGIEAHEEKRKLEAHPDYVWQRMLWQRLAEEPRWQGKAFLSSLPASLDALAHAPKSMKRLEVSEGRFAVLPEALHIFTPFVVPPLMLPIIKAYAHAGRDVWFYLLNPCSEYWFDLVPQRLFDWRAAESRNDSSGVIKAGDHREVGHPILADNGLSVRANIDRLWRFTEAPDTAGPSAGDAPEPKGWLAISELDQTPTVTSVESSGERRDQVPLPRRIETYDAFLRRLFGGFRDIRAETDVAAQSYYLEANEPTLLRRVQDSILLLEPDLNQRATAAMPLFRSDDDSIHFVAAPTATRELEGLADWLQAKFEADKSLRPEDVLVVTPDITAASPLIEKVFGSLPEGARIDYRITGAETGAENAPAQAMSALVSLLDSRCRREDFCAWLALPPIAERFGFTVEDLGTISSWLAAAGFRFGLSDAHLEAIDPVTFAKVRETSLARALERLVFGLTLPDEAEEPWGDVLPVREGSESWVSVSDRPDLLMSLCEIAQKLERLRLLATKGECSVAPLSSVSASDSLAAQTPDAWTAWIAEALEVLFAKETPENDYGAIRSAADTVRGEIELAVASSEVEEGAAGAANFSVPFRLFMKVFLERLGEASTSGRPGSAVTFAGMSALRGLPYKIIAVIGLNHDCSFPGTMRFEEFDLMGAAPRRGDRDSRVDNRNVFLDLLLAARKTFLVSYVCGTNEADLKEPSIVAGELRDWLLSFAKGREARRQAEAQLTTKLTLNNFSVENFRAQSGHWQSTDKRLLEAVKDAEAEGYGACEAYFADVGLREAERIEETPFETLWRFWRQSAQWVLTESGIQLPQVTVPGELSLLPSKDGLDVWSRRNDAFERLHSGDSRDDVKRLWASDPRLGAYGVRDWALEGELDLAQMLDTALSEREAVLLPLEDRTLLLRLPASASPQKKPARITHRLTRLYRNTVGESDGAILRLVATVSQGDGSPVLRAFLEHLLAIATGLNLTTEVLHREKPKKGSQSDTIALTVFPNVSQKAAKRFLAAFYGLYAQTFVCAAQLPDYSERKDMLDERAEAILFRGRDLAAAVRERETLEALLKAMPGSGDAVACEALMAQFEAAEKAMFRARAKAQKEAQQKTEKTPGTTKKKKGSSASKRFAEDEKNATDEPHDVKEAL